jgi:divalent metal cation (Fe/Co/Zn/Cd) transporter
LGLGAPGSLVGTGSCVEPEEVDMADQAHTRLVSLAIVASAFSVAWNFFAAGVALIAARVTGSPSLAGFGLAAAIDSVGSVVVIWYFRAHMRDAVQADRREKIALRAIGSVLILAGAYVALRSLLLLREGSTLEVSAVGVSIATVSVLVLPLLAVVKLRLAAKIPSAPLRADGILTAGAAVLAAVALVAVSLQGAAGFWWLDPAIALVIAAILAAEGTRTLRLEKA